MTFYEAALRVLEEAGTPLLSTDITKRAIDKGLLSHIGKTPEVTMLSRLAAIARRSRDRKLQVTAKDTFALTDWMLPEDPEALAATGLVELNPEEALPPYRPSERHPEAHAEFLRTIGRQSERKRRGDDDRKKKYPPVAEVAFEVLDEAQTSLVPSELLARIKAREGQPDDATVNALVEGLAVDNQKRLDEGRRPLFAAVRSEGGEVQISAEAQTEGGSGPLEVQQAFCAAAGLNFENGRVVLKGEQRASAAVSVAPASASEALVVLQSVRQAGKDAHKAMARVLRTKLGELDLGTFEKTAVRMLHSLHFRELKVSRRSKDGPLLTARRREGSLELRYAVRLLKGTAAVERRHVQELRRELSSSGANVGLLLTAGEAKGDAKSECTSGPLVLLWAGDALAEKFFEAKVGVCVTTVEVFELDEAFFLQAKADADEASKRREERTREREQRPEEAPVAASPVERQPEAPGDEREEDDDGEEGDEGPEDAAEAGAAADPANPDARRKRKRRRRRRRGGRPDGAEGAPASAGGAGSVGATNVGPGDASGPSPEVNAEPAPVVSVEAAAPAETPAQSDAAPEQA